MFLKNDIFKIIWSKKMWLKWLVAYLGVIYNLFDYFNWTLLTRGLVRFKFMRQTSDKPEVQQFFSTLPLLEFAFEISNF